MLSESTSADTMTLRAHPGRPAHRGQVGEELRQLAVIEHAVLGEVPNASEPT
jgi:hypothetical protein